MRFGVSLLVLCGYVNRGFTSRFQRKKNNMDNEESFEMLLDIPGVAVARVDGNLEVSASENIKVIHV